MRKGREWLAREFSKLKFGSSPFTHSTLYYHEALALVEQLDPVAYTTEVPEFVDEWFKSNSPQSWWKKIAEWENEVSDEDRKVVDWYQDYNEDDFIIAWITGDYTVKEKQNHRIRIGDMYVGNFNVNQEYAIITKNTRDAFVFKDEVTLEKVAELVDGTIEKL